MKPSAYTSVIVLLTGLSLRAFPGTRAAADPPTAPPAPSAATLKPNDATTAAIDAAITTPPLKHAICGVFVRSLASGVVLYDHDSDISLTPASCNKLLTVSTALTRLGPDFVYHTILYRTGTIDANGVLTGDLILHGTGDPSFSAADLTAMAKALQASGVKQIQGRIVVDDSRFDDERLGDGWTEGDDPFEYQAQISALNCDENVIAIQVNPATTVGQPAMAILPSGTTYVTINNTAGTVAAPPADDAARAPRIDFYRERARNIFDVTGSIAIGSKPASEALTVEDPARFAGTRLGEILNGTGIRFVGAGAISVVRGVTPTDAVVVYDKASAPLAGLVKHLLKVSDNLYAETLLKTVAARDGGRGSSRAGARAVRAFLSDAGVDVTGINQVDGCGLSRFDMVTPRDLADILTYVDQKSPPPVRAAFEDALPIAGVDGTLRNRMKRTGAKGMVTAKTGSLAHVSCLAGFVTTHSGERLVFAMMMNNYVGGDLPAHVAQDKIATILAGL